MARDDLPAAEHRRMSRWRFWTLVWMCFLTLATIAGLTIVQINVDDDRDRAAAERDRNRALAVCVRDSIVKSLDQVGSFQNGISDTELERFTITLNAIADC